MQLDADEDGEPFFRPPSITPAPIRPHDDQQSSDEQQRSAPAPGEVPQGLGASDTDQAAATPTTAEQED